MHCQHIMCGTSYNRFGDSLPWDTSKSSVLLLTHTVSVTPLSPIQFLNTCIQSTALLYNMILNSPNTRIHNLLCNLSEEA